MKAIYFYLGALRSVILGKSYNDSLFMVCAVAAIMQVNGVSILNLATNPPSHNSYVF